MGCDSRNPALSSFTSGRIRANDHTPALYVTSGFPSPVTSVAICSRTRARSLINVGRAGELLITPATLPGIRRKFTYNVVLVYCYIYCADQGTDVLTVRGVRLSPKGLRSLTKYENIDAVICSDMTSPRMTK